MAPKSKDLEGLPEWISLGADRCSVLPYARSIEQGVCESADGTAVLVSCRSTRPVRDPSQCVCAGAGGGKPGELLSPTRAIWSAARGHQSGTVDTVPGHWQPVGWRRVTRCGCHGAHLSMEPRDGPTPQRCIRDAYQGLDVPGLALQHVCDRDHVCVSSVLDTMTRCPQDVVGKAQRVMRRMC